jgi:hypothetical protein
MQRAKRSSNCMSAGDRVCSSSPRTEGGSRLTIGWQARNARSGGCGVPEGKWGRPSLAIWGSGRFCAPLARTHRTHSRTMAATSGDPVVGVAAGEPPRTEQPASPASRSSPTMHRRMTPPWPESSAGREALKPAPWAHHRRMGIAIPLSGEGSYPARVIDKTPGKRSAKTGLTPHPRPTIAARRGTLRLIGRRAMPMGASEAADAGGGECTAWSWPTRPPG